MEGRGEKWETMNEKKNEIEMKRKIHHWNTCVSFKEAKLHVCNLQVIFSILTVQTNFLFVCW